MNRCYELSAIVQVCSKGGFDIARMVEEKAFRAGGTAWKPSGVSCEWRIGVVSVVGRCGVWEGSKLDVRGKSFERILC